MQDLETLHREVDAFASDHSMQKAIIAEAEALNKDFESLLEERSRLKAWMELEELKDRILALSASEQGPAAEVAHEVLESAKKIAWSPMAENDIVVDAEEMDAEMKKMELSMKMLRESQDSLKAHRDTLQRELDAMRAE